MHFGPQKPFLDPKDHFYDLGMGYFGSILPKSISNDQTLLSDLHGSRIYHLNQFSSILIKNFHAFWVPKAIFGPKKSFSRFRNGLFRFNIAKIYFK